MNSFIKLAQTFIKANGMSETKDKGQKIKIVVLSIFSMLFILLPVVIGVGVFVKVMTDTLRPIGFTSFGLELVLYILSCFSIIFGINIVFSEFYFSSDIEYILPLPLRAMQIVGAKFASVFYMENIMQFALILSCVIGFGIGSEMGLYSWIVGIIGIVTLPILPLVYCAIFSMVIMGLTRFIRNKELIQRISVALIFVMLIVLVASIGSLQTMDIGTTIETMAKGNQTVFNVLGIIFSNVLFLVKAMGEKSVSAFIIYIIINVIGILIMIALSEVLYFKGVIGLTNSVSTKKTKDVDYLLKNNKQCGQAYAYFMKEVRILIKTPTYFTNCVAINFIWPIFVYAIVKLTGADISISDLQDRYISRENFRILLMIGIVVIAILLTALNSISSNSLSREGKHFQFMKYIPVDYKIQWNVKALVGALFPAIGIFVFYIPASIVIKVPIVHMIINIILIMLAILFVAYMGIYIDSIQPKLIWDDELSSLRENYNTFFAMAIAIALGVIIGVGGYIVFMRNGFEFYISSLILGVVLIFLNILVWAISKHSAVKNIEEQEEA